MAIKIKKSLINKFLLLTLFFSLLGQPMMAFAEYDPLLTPDNAEEGNKPSLIEKHLSTMLINLSNWVIDVSKAQDVSVLVFQDASIVKDNNEQFGNTTNANRDNLEYGIFPAKLFAGIEAFYNTFKGVMTVPIVVLLVGAGLFLLLDLMRSDEVRSKGKETLFGIITVILLIRFGSWLWGWIITVNYWIVDGIRQTLKEQGIAITRFTQTIWDSGQYSDITASMSFGTAVLIVFAVFMTFVINYQYIMRLIQLAMLIILFPIAILSAMIPNRNSVLNIWFTTFASNVFLQAGHAVALGLFFFALSRSPELGFWLIAAMFFGLPAMADVVNRLVSGFMGEGGGGGMKTSASNTSGIAGLMAISKIGSSIAGGRGAKGSLEEKSKLAEADKTPQQEFGSTLSSSTSSEGSSMSSGGSTSAPPSSGSSVSASATRSGSSSSPSRAGGSGNRSARALTMEQVAKGGKVIANYGGKLAKSDGVRGVARGGVILGSAGAGAIASTMMTGRGGAGAMLGAKIGDPLSKVAAYGQQKFGKALEQGGELIRGTADASEGKVDSPYHYTNERLGYENKAQMIDSQEMGRMGQELIGGKTGQMIGRAVGASGKLVAKASKTPQAREMLETLNHKKSLGEQLEHSRAMGTQTKASLDTAKKDLQYANTSYGPTTPAGIEWSNQKNIEADRAAQVAKANPHDMSAHYRHLEAEQNRKAPHPKIQEAQKVVQDYETQQAQYDYTSRQLEMKQQNFYRIQESMNKSKQQAQEMKNFQSQYRSSGSL